MPLTRPALRFPTPRWTYIPAERGFVPSTSIAPIPRETARRMGAMLFFKIFLSPRTQAAGNYFRKGAASAFTISRRLVYLGSTAFTTGISSCFSLSLARALNGRG